MQSALTYPLVNGLLGIVHALVAVDDLCPCYSCWRCCSSTAFTASSMLSWRKKRAVLSRSCAGTMQVPPWWACSTQHTTSTTSELVLGGLLNYLGLSISCVEPTVVLEEEGLAKLSLVAGTKWARAPKVVGQVCTSCLPWDFMRSY